MEGGWECKEVYKVKDYKTFSGFLRAVKSALRAIEIDGDLSYIVKIHELSPDRRYEYYVDKVSGFRLSVSYSAYKKLVEFAKENGIMEMLAEDVLRLVGELSMRSWDFEYGWKMGFDFDYGSGHIHFGGDGVHNFKKRNNCPKCEKPVKEGEGVFYVGYWYHRECFKEWYGKKFGLV